MLTQIGNNAMWTQIWLAVEKNLLTLFTQLLERLSKCRSARYEMPQKANNEIKIQFRNVPLFVVQNHGDCGKGKAERTKGRKKQAR